MQYSSNPLEITYILFELPYVQDFNNVYTEQMTEWLFANKDFGLDIVSLNVQRGRDHQIQGYTTYKYMCGLGSNYIWEDLKDLIPEELVHRLSHAYQNPGDLDMYIAQVMETVLPGTQLGTVIQNQYLHSVIFITKSNLLKLLSVRKDQSQNYA